jgi:hypothetical protein
MSSPRMKCQREKNCTCLFSYPIFIRISRSRICPLHPAFTKEWFRNSCATISVTLNMLPFQNRTIICSGFTKKRCVHLTVTCVGWHGRDQGHGPRFANSLRVKAAYKNLCKTHLSGCESSKRPPHTRDSANTLNEQLWSTINITTKKASFQMLVHSTFTTFLYFSRCRSCSAVKTVSLNNVRIRCGSQGCEEVTVRLQP